MYWVSLKKNWISVVLGRKINRGENSRKCFSFKEKSFDESSLCLCVSAVQKRPASYAHDVMSNDPIVP